MERQRERESGDIISATHQLHITDLVEADAVEFATEVDALRTDTEDVFLLESTLSVDGADRHGGRQRWRYSDGHDVKNSQYHVTC